MESGGSKGMVAMKAVQAKNRAPAPIQITAEQIVLEARDRAAAKKPPPPARHVMDTLELAEHRMHKRKEFEEALGKNRRNRPLWAQYAKWEESQNEVERARSIYERMLEIDFKEPGVWVRYAEMEMRNKFVNRARNVWDRAVTLLPRVDLLWYKFTYMEELLGNINGARTVFERWMTWEPAEQAWASYINLELRAGERERARAVYERFVACKPSQAAYLKFAKWEERNGQRALARRVYERLMDELSDDERTQEAYLAFGGFEERCGETERARAVYRYGLERLPKAAAEELYRAYVSFEKQWGEMAGVEDVIITKRRAAYEEAVTANPLNYDAWFDYARLEEAEGSAARVRAVYERAVAAVPPVPDKRYWRRYIYLWINYALYEELDAPEEAAAGEAATASRHARVRAVYAAALAAVPHKLFTFAKLWVLAAQHEVRCKDMPAARKLFGTSLGLCPRPRVLKAYVTLELQLGNIDRARTLLTKCVELWPLAVGGWLRFADLEKSLGEDERARAIYDLAIGQPALDTPEAAWKAYIDFEIERGEYTAARALYGRLLSRTSHVKVWLSLAAFEASVVGSEEGAREAYSRGYAHFKAEGDSGKEARALLVETWHAFEQALVEDEVAAGGDGSLHAGGLDKVAALLPRRVTKKVPVPGSTPGVVLGYEEVADWVFPDDESKPAAFKLLALAAKWKAAGGGAVDAVLADDAHSADSGDRLAGTKRGAEEAGLGEEGEQQATGADGGPSHAAASDPNALDLDDM